MFIDALTSTKPGLDRHRFGGEALLTARSYIPGVVLCSLIAMAAIAVGTVTPAPAMISAILIGLLLHKTSQDSTFEPGISWSAKALLYAGVALLGLRIDMTMVMQAGWVLPAIALSTLLATLLMGRLIGRCLGIDKLLVVMMSGAVAICGVSAAAAICCVLPRCKERDSQLAMTIAGITVLSTIAMLLYPTIAHILGLSGADAGAFIGGSLHNVSQAVGAGYSVSGEAGDMATVIKLIRVSALLPVIIMIGLIYGRSTEAASKKSWKVFLPPFMIAFFLFALINYYGLLQEQITSTANQLSEFFLVASLVAIGMKTKLREVVTVGPKPMIAMTLTTVFMAIFVIAMVAALSYFGYALR